MARRPPSHDPAPWSRRARLAELTPAGLSHTIATQASLGLDHPLADPAISRGLANRSDEIEAAFALIEPTLRDLASRQFEDGFAPLAEARLRDQLGVEVSAPALRSSWTDPLDMRRLHARCVLGVFRRLIERAFDRDLARLTDGEPADTLIRRWGFHAVDISPCADGRLSGVLDYILRVPPSVVAWRRSHAGAMFDIEDSLRHWEAMELRRWRDAVPNPANEGTRYLKIGVYHFSGSDPTRGGCAAHGSDHLRAAGALKQRLEDFELAVRRLHGHAAPIATLLIGVDTDTDAIRVHIPDTHGRMALDRVVDNSELYAATAVLEREAAKTAIRDAVAAATGVSADDPATEGMRWFCGYLLKNNLGQLDSVIQRHRGPYPDGGHTERLIVVGDPIDEVQLRNLAFQAQMDTVEAGAPDLFVGIQILHKRLQPLGLAIPVLAHVRFDPRLPGAEARARAKAARLRTAILANHPSMAERGQLHVEAVVRSGDSPTLIPIDPGEAML